MILAIIISHPNVPEARDGRLRHENEIIDLPCQRRLYYVGVPWLMSVRLLFSVTVVSLVPEEFVWSFPSWVFAVEITWQ